MFGGVVASAICGQVSRRVRRQCQAMSSEFCSYQAARSRDQSMGELNELSSVKCFGGQQKTFKHQSRELGCEMNVAVFLPAAAAQGKVPAVVWLSGLTCTEQNFVQKAGGQRLAAELGLAIICPDTSPRGCNVPGEDERWDLGTGAGFYVDAECEPWAKNYRMFSYVTRELRGLVGTELPIDVNRLGISGHSMGGHGALTLALRCPGLFRSVSAFAPICSPSRCPWGELALGAYLGPDRAGWDQWDASKLLASYSGPALNLLVDQGADDQFLHQKQLLPETLFKACEDASVPLTLRMQPGYDHSYFFVATFLEDHLRHHAGHLGCQ